MDTLTFAQTLFYFVFVAVIIFLGAVFAILAYHLIRLAKELRRISQNVSAVSREAEERVKEIAERFSDLPFLSFLKTKRRGKSDIKSRNNTRTEKAQ